MKNNTAALSVIAIASALALSACGGGGGSAQPGASAPPASTATTGNVSPPQYAANSAQMAAFTLLNQQRQQCGFPALTENTVLDQAAVAHAKYMGQNGGAITDTEVATNSGFTGAQYSDRATAKGFPSGAWVAGVSGGYYTNSTLTETQYGQQLVYELLSGVYHIAIGVLPATEIGVGWNETTFNGFPAIQATLSLANPQSISGPRTFPCQGTAGVAYSAGGESPTPPNTAGNWGTPIAVAGNLTDTIVLTSGTIIPTGGGTTINLNLLDSANDPNKELPSYIAVAYPTAPLSPNTGYSVSITGTYNGTLFSRSFTFTTGNVVG
ncbi:MAG: CAP domain-containing protein [Burkholderiales bacterium]|nr:CAP domain-containing protein [Burkholderiales bacterium]